MAKLSEAEKRSIVQALACYDTPSQVVEAIKEEYGTVLDRGHVGCYDPTKAAGKQLAKKWADLFHATRARFQEEIAEIPIAGQAYRLRQLQRMHQDATGKRNPVLAMQILEQAAKEAGGHFTNKRQTELTGKGGGPIETATLSKDEYKKARLEMLIDDDC